MYDINNIISTAICYLGKLLREFSSHEKFWVVQKVHLWVLAFFFFFGVLRKTRTNFLANFSFSFSFLLIWVGGCSLNLLWKLLHEVCKSNCDSVHPKLIHCFVPRISEYNGEGEQKDIEVVKHKQENLQTIL